MIEIRRSNWYRFSIKCVFLVLIFLLVNVHASAKNANSTVDAVRIWIVDQANPKATDQGPGTKVKPFKTISAAEVKTGLGDTVLVHQGIYRERVAPARGGGPGKPVVYRAAPGERVVVKGSEVWQPDWKKVQGGPGILSAPLSSKLFGDYNPFQIEGKRMHLDGHRSR